MEFDRRLGTIKTDNLMTDFVRESRLTLMQRKVRTLHRNIYFILSSCPGSPQFPARHQLAAAARAAADQLGAGRGVAGAGAARPGQVQQGPHPEHDPEQRRLHARHRRGRAHGEM